VSAIYVASMLLFLLLISKAPLNRPVRSKSDKMISTQRDHINNKFLVAC